MRFMKISNWKAVDTLKTGATVENVLEQKKHTEAFLM